MIRIKSNSETVTVKNREGHEYSEKTNFLEYWKEKKKYSSNHLVSCARIGCSKTASCGGHVYIADTGKHPNYYIVPLCDSCNHTDFKNGFEVEKSELILAPSQD